MKLYISDLHLYHENVMKLDNRNFADIYEMNKFIIEQWNNKVQSHDQVIVLGDMFWTKEPDEINYVLNRLKGKICLIQGNHDVRWLGKNGVKIERFEYIKQYAEFNDGDSTIIASHYPIFCYNHQYLVHQNGTPKTYMLYGHVHNTHDEILVNKFIQSTRETTLHGSTADRKIPCNMINCFCKFSNYTPLSLKEWITIDESRRSQMELPTSTLIQDEL